jgi:hypothetical protein
MNPTANRNSSNARLVHNGIGMSPAKPRIPAVFPIFLPGQEEKKKSCRVDVDGVSESKYLIRHAEIKSVKPAAFEPRMLFERRIRNKQ